MKQTLKQLAAATSALALLIALIPAQPAQAAFPGLNGRIIYQSNHEGNYELYTTRADGTDFRNITNNTAFDGDPSVSPDGTKVAFRSDRDGNQEIYIMKIDGSNVVRITNSVGNDNQPSWSPDSKKVAFKSSRVVPDQIFTVNEDGTDTTQITTDATQGSNWPKYSPDGNQILFTKQVTGFGSEIFKVGADGSSETRITTEVSNEIYGNWSPDGSRITFYSNRSGRNEIYTMKSDGTDIVQVTNVLSGSNAVSDYSPDGKKIIFFTNRSGTNEVYNVDLNGENEQRLSANGVAVVVQPLTIPPTTINSSLTLDATQGPVTYDAPANHTDTYEEIDPTSITITTPPQKGAITVDPTTGAITYTPNQQAKTKAILAFIDNFFFKPAAAQSTGQDSFSYQVCSTANSQLCTTATVTVDLANGALANTGSSSTTLQVVGYAICSVATLGVAWLLRRKRT